MSFKLNISSTSDSAVSKLDFINPGFSLANIFP